MTWLKIDDGFWHDQKIEALSARAFRAHVMAMCSCAEYLTDGYVSEKIAKRVGAKDKVLVELLSEVVPKRSPLWLPHIDGGFMIHDYLDYNPSRADIESGREMRRVRAQKAADARWHAQSNAQSNGAGIGPSTDVSMPRPDPSREFKVQEDDDEQIDQVVLVLLREMGEHEHGQAHLELMAFKARGASEFDFRSVTNALAKKRPANPRAYAATSLGNRLRERNSA